MDVLVERCTAATTPYGGLGTANAAIWCGPIEPSDECMFLTKVRHSAFYCTTLDCCSAGWASGMSSWPGQAIEQCILYIALDAYMPHYSVRVLNDAVGHIDPHLGEAALMRMERKMRAHMLSATDYLGDSRQVL